MKTIPLLVFAVAAVSLAAPSASAQSNYEAPYTFTTFAGYGLRFADGTGSEARFNNPYGVAVDAAGNVYVADSGNDLIRKISPAGVVVTFAGVPGKQGAVDGAGRFARFTQPFGVAVDGDGTVYVADSSNGTIRKITPGGIVSTLAGLAATSGNADGTGSDARFNTPSGPAVDGAGNVYVADRGNHTIRKITPSGEVSTLAGLAGSSGNANGTASAARFNQPSGVAVDGGGNVYVADRGNHAIRRITPSGDVSTFAGVAGSQGSADGAGSAARFRSPRAVAVDTAGNVLVADTANNIIRQISPSGTVSTIAGLAGNSGSIDGPGSAARFTEPSGLAVDADGNVYVGDLGNLTVRKITPSGDVSTLAGLPGSAGSADGDATAARFFRPTGVTADNGGNVYVADSNHTIRKITPSGVVSTLAGQPGIFGSADGTGSAAQFRAPYGPAVDGAGNVYVADAGNHTVRKITPAGVVSTLAGFAGFNGSVDGTGSAARFDDPRGIAVDASGNVYVSEYSAYTIRKITPAGVVSTLAGLAYSSGSIDGTGSGARFDFPQGLAVDGNGTIYVADYFSNTIRKITPAGVVTTLAGSPGTFGSADGTGSAASFGGPNGVGVDSAGNVYVADTLNSLVRKITPSGVVSTIAGSEFDYGMADGTGEEVAFFQPTGVAVDGAGNVYASDWINDTIRVGVPAPPVITSPLTATAVIGQGFVYQFQTSYATTRDVTGLPSGLSFNSSLSAIVGTPETEGTFQIGLTATNGNGTTNATLTLTVQAAPSGPAIISSTAATGRTGRPFKFQVVVSGGSSETRVDAAGLPPGLTFNSVTGLISGTPDSDGSFAITLTLSEGIFTFAATGTLQLTFTSDPAVPVIISPSETSLVPDQPFTYQIVAPTSVPDDPVTYTLIGGLPDGLEFDPVTGTISGTPTVQSRRGKPLSGGAINPQVFARNSFGVATLPLDFYLAGSGVVNIATRLSVGTDQNVLIGGFIVGGKAPKRVVIRAIGPSLTAGGSPLPGALADPTLLLQEGENVVDSNDDWRSAREQEILDTKIPPSDGREAAMTAILNPGSYTAVISGKDGGTGVSLIEVYDLGSATLSRANAARLANISTRGFVQAGEDVMIGGFIVSEAASRVIVRAIGPSLGAVGVEGALQDTTLDFIDGNGVSIAFNDDWRTGGQEQQIVETTLQPGDDREAAVVATLNPGGYTAVVRGKDNTTGVGLVEVYVLQ